MSDATCDPSMCRTQDGSGGFDCWADGVEEKFECEDGYEVVMTGKVHESMPDLREITCCPVDVIVEKVFSFVIIYRVKTSVCSMRLCSTFSKLGRCRREFTPVLI